MQFDYANKIRSNAFWLMPHFWAISENSRLHAPVRQLPD